MTQFLYVSKKYPVHIYSRNTNKYIFILNLEGEKTMNKTQQGIECYTQTQIF